MAIYSGSIPSSDITPPSDVISELASLTTPTTPSTDSSVLTSSNGISKIFTKGNQTI